MSRNEQARLKALASYQLLDTPEEATYDAFTRLARHIMGTPISTISLVDDRRQWFKSHSGLDIRETPREIAFCASVVEGQSSMVVADAHDDARFRDNPLVTGAPHIRFYAGVPLTTPDGYTIGTLCAIDDRPRNVTPEQIDSLQTLAQVLFVVLESRRRFLTIFDAVNLDVVTIDPQTGSIVFASRGARAHLGYSQRDLSGMAASAILPALSGIELPSLARRIRAGQEILFDAELRRRDGTTYPVELRVDLTYDQNAERLLAIALDLSDRKAQEREISLLLDAINAAGDAILVYRVDELGTLVLSYMNDTYARQSGYSREEAIGRDLEWFRAAMPDDEGMRSVRGAIAAGTPIQAEIVSYRKDGSTFWNQVTLHPIRDASERVTHWISVERDITEDVNRTSALEEEHDRLLALTLAARRLFTVLDARSLVQTARDVVRELLNAHARVLAISVDERAIEVQELGNVDWTDAFADELVAQSIRYRMRVISEAQDRAATYVGRFGDARYVLELRAHSSHALRNTDLFVFDLVAEYFAVAARNVTLYNELEERRSAVMELSQTKSDLIAMLAHDFRGPLTTIVGFADLTAEIGELDPEQREFLDTIKRSALQLAELATDTLTLSRLERNEVTLQVEDVDLEALLRSIVSQQADRRSIVLSVSGDGHVTGDPDRLRQVFSNLVDNAIKYSPGAPSPEIALSGGENEVRVIVRDHGIGIPAGELSRVFDRFSRASNARTKRIPGTGFGLFITKQLLQLHGGTIAVDSAEDKGTTVTTTLPRRIARSSAPRTVVILERESDRAFLADGIREAGYRALTASSLDDVLAIADAQAVDALIVAMEDGALNRTRAAQFRAFGRERAIPIVAVGNAAPELGAYATLTRPVLVGDIIAALESLLAPPLR